MSDYTGDYDVLAAQSEEHPDTGEEVETIQARSYGEGAVIVNLVLAEGAPEGDFVLTEDEAVVVADLTDDQLADLTETFNAAFVEESLGDEGVAPPEGEFWQIGQHPLFGWVRFSRTDDRDGKAVIHAENLRDFTEQLLDSA